MILALVFGVVVGLAAGIAIGRGDSRRERRQSVVVLQPRRIYSAWSKGERKS